MIHNLDHDTKISIKLIRMFYIIIIIIIIEYVDQSTTQIDKTSRHH